MSQINIYVPDDLKAQLAQHPELKLSAIASQAFRRTLADIAEKRRVTPAPYATEPPASPMQSLCYGCGFTPEERASFPNGCPQRFPAITNCPNVPNVVYPTPCTR